MFKLTLIAMIIIFIIGVVVRVYEDLKEPKEEGEHRKHIDRKRKEMKIPCRDARL